ncbi:thioredoxin-2 [Planococcus citri]|uniref:thioredoxin-2 n=1 Tax=Planococcus citri TaxID=170843 RepID=UPI0031F79346
MVYHIKDSADLEQQLSEAGSKLVVIDFFAAWCGPCKFISPKLEELSTVETDVVFLKIDVDECEDLAEAYEISSMPTFIFIKNKKKVDSFSGANADKLKEIVEKLKNA